MSDFTIFVAGIIVTLVAGMGVITSQIFIAYKKDYTFYDYESDRKILDEYV